MSSPGAPATGLPTCLSGRWNVTLGRSSKLLFLAPPKHDHRDDHDRAEYGQRDREWSCEFLDTFAEIICSCLASFLRKSQRSPGSLLLAAVGQWIPGTQGRTQAKRRIGGPIPS
jgi:hypothetical protein